MAVSEGRIPAASINQYVVLRRPKKKATKAPKAAKVGSHESGGGSGAEPGPIDDAGFDPGDHTVAEVWAYLEDHPDEMEAVLAAEAAGKNRSSLVGD